MQAKLHPKYGKVLYRCASCSTEWVGSSTRLDGKEVEYEGETLPLIALEICSNCHPFYSGKKMFVDSAGRVDKFNRRYGRGQLRSKKSQKTATGAEEESSS